MTRSHAHANRFTIVKLDQVNVCLYSLVNYLSYFSSRFEMFAQRHPLQMKWCIHSQTVNISLSFMSLTIRVCQLYSQLVMQRGTIIEQYRHAGLDGWDLYVLVYRGPWYSKEALWEVNIPSDYKHICARHYWTDQRICGWDTDEILSPVVKTVKA